MHSDSAERGARGAPCGARSRWASATGVVSRDMVYVPALAQASAFGGPLLINPMNVACWPTRAAHLARPNVASRCIPASAERDAAVGCELIDCIPLVSSGSPHPPDSRHSCRPKSGLWRHRPFSVPGLHGAPLRSPATARQQRSPAETSRQRLHTNESVFERHTGSPASASPYRPKPRRDHACPALSFARHTPPSVPGPAPRPARAFRS
jgi:hypothetical protein